VTHAVSHFVSYLETPSGKAEQLRYGVLAECEHLLDNDKRDCPVGRSSEGVVAF
jgi:hypothetical protein